MRRVLVVLAAALAIAPPPAQARMAVGVENDEALKHDAAAYLARADGLGAAWTRLTVSSARWPAEQDAYVAAASAAVADGKRLLVSLVTWRDYPGAAAWTAFARSVIARMAPYADAWSPMNEPNQSSMAPATPVRCVLDPRAAPSTSEAEDGARIERRWRRTPGGRWTRVETTVDGRRRTVVVTFRRGGGGGWAPGPARRIPLLRRSRIAVATDAELTDCRAQADGAAYRRIWDAVAPVLSTDAGAALVAGDLAPSAGDETFMRVFASTGWPAVAPDVLGVHPYDFRNPPGRRYEDGSFALGSVESAARYARSHGMRLWASEWGYHPAQPAAWWFDGLRRLARAGAELTVLYDTPAPGGGGWDTAMRPRAYEQVARFVAQDGGGPAP